MAALFLLNLYYKDDTYKVGTYENMIDENIFYGKKYFHYQNHDSDLFSVRTFHFTWGINYDLVDFYASTYVIAPDVRQYIFCMELLNQYGSIFDSSQEEIFQDNTGELERKLGDSIRRLTMSNENGIAKWVKCNELTLNKFGRYTLRLSLNKNQKFDYLHYSDLEAKDWVKELREKYLCDLEVFHNV